LRERVDSVSAAQIGDIIIGDPLMTLKLFAYLGTHKSRRQQTDIETVTGALIMLGVPPFFRAFDVLTPVSEHLRADLEAQKNVVAVLKRAIRAAGYARRWAVHRRDLDFEAVVIAALLHDAAEMLMWCYAPNLAREVQKQLRDTPGMRSADAQRVVLGIELNELEVALMRRWKLPALLIRMEDDHHAEDPQVRTVLCAVNLARHSANGWDDPALPDDYRMIGHLLQQSPEYVQRSLEPDAAA
jgi:HD-like signal output (HDOD) protein